ncbi:efflux RND transporter permease subunit [Bacillus carboniphilus]|uniref:Efflux RND transporter permease subunit n=1 Tax=Bacillus carboniphilus TaxID=86663 RepID=A0ABP3FUN6_9BACI
MNISHFSIRRPIFTLVTMLLILILGGVSVLRIPLKLIPDLNPPVAVVVANYPGAGPKEVLEKVTKPLEANLTTLPGIKTIQSTSQEGANFIFLEFSWSTSIDDIQNDVITRINQTSLPEDVEPRFMKFDPSQFPIIQFSLRGEEAEQKDLENLTNDLKVDLERVNGVASVSLSGVTTEDIVVTLNQNQLKANQLTQDDIISVIRANEISLPGEPVISNGEQLTTRIISQLKSPDEISDLIITKNLVTGENILLSDVAVVEKKERNQNVITRADGQPAMLLSVLQESDANTAQVSKQFQENLEELLSKEQYQGLKADILFDQGDYIQMAIGNITNSLLIGGALAMLVLFLFLRNIKSPIIIGVAIPYSVIVTFVLMYFSDFTLNIMTMGALALGIGMLVDNAIVVIENINRHLGMGKTPKVAASDGAKEIASAITASTLTTVAVFIPVVFISGIIGEIFTEFALTISFSLLGSLAVALTVVPMLASKWLKPSSVVKEENRQQSFLIRLVENVIKWSLSHRFIVLFITFLLLVGGGLGLTRVGTQFLPSTDEGFFSIGIRLDNGVAFSETEGVVDAIEEKLNGHDEVDVYVSTIGSTQESSFRGGIQSHRAEIYVKMKEASERDQTTLEFIDEIRSDLENAAIAQNETAVIRMATQSSAGTSPQTLSFTVRDPNEQALNEAVDKIDEAISEIEHVTDVSTDLEDTIKEIQIAVNREQAISNGLVPAQIATLVSNVTRGVQATQIVEENGDVTGVFVEYREDARDSIENLRKLQIRTGAGTYVTLDQIADISTGEGPSAIHRSDQQLAVQFTVKYSTDTNLGHISNEVDLAIQDLNLSDSTTLEFSGDRELLDDAIWDMGLAFVLAIIFVYLVMAAQFESLKTPFVIMFTVPLMIIGVNLALVFTGTPISVTAIIGVIVLAGIVVNNAIVIVDYINQKKEAGLDTYEAIIDSVKVRVRPILMTALTTILGLLPLALGIGQGTELNQPMGITVIGGLLSSTFLTLFIIPIVYSYFDRTTRSMKKYFRKKKREEQYLHHASYYNNQEKSDRDEDETEKVIRLLEESLEKLKRTSKNGDEI